MDSTNTPPAQDQRKVSRDRQEHFWQIGGQALYIISSIFWVFLSTKASLASLPSMSFLMSQRYEVKFGVQRSGWASSCLLTQVQPCKILAVVTFIRFVMLLAPFLSYWGVIGDSKYTAMITLALDFIKGSDAMFIFYGFMSAAVGDVCKLALRMGGSLGILYGLTQFSRFALSTAGHLRGGLVILGIMGAAFKLFLGCCLLYAPKPYQNFTLPGFSFSWKRHWSASFPRTL